MEKKLFRGIVCLNFIQGAKILAIFSNQTIFGLMLLVASKNHYSKCLNMQNQWEII